MEVTGLCAGFLFLCTFWLLPVFPLFRSTVSKFLIFLISLQSSYALTVTECLYMPQIYNVQLPYECTHCGREFMYVSVTSSQWSVTLQCDSVCIWWVQVYSDQLPHKCSHCNRVDIYYCYRFMVTSCHTNAHTVIECLNTRGAEIDMLSCTQGTASLDVRPAWLLLQGKLHLYMSCLLISKGISSPWY